MFRRTFLIALAPILALSSGCSMAQSTSGVSSSPRPIALHGNKQTVEISGVLLAARHYYPSDVSIKMGGFPNLYGEVGGSGEPGLADVATNAETQLLRVSVKHPDIRYIMNVSEGLYRVVARKSAGIASVADLKGKRVATIAQTSSGYFLKLMLEQAGLHFEDVIAKPIMPLSEMAGALQRREVDAVVIWEPWSEHARRLLGEDVTELDGHGVYRELFNLYATAKSLADPAERAKIVRMTRAIMDATAEIHKDPATAQALLAEASGFTPRDIADTWKHHAFTASQPADLLDVIVKQEQWLAVRDKRRARSREELAQFIDTSVYEEARAMGPQPRVK